MYFTTYEHLRDMEAILVVGPHLSGTSLSARVTRNDLHSFRSMNPGFFITRLSWPLGTEPAPPQEKLVARLFALLFKSLSGACEVASTDLARMQIKGLKNKLQRWTIRGIT